MPSSTASPTSITNTGSGVPWQLPSYAVNTGTGSQNIVALIGFSITSNVITITTPPQATPFVAGQVVTISNMVHNTFLNSAVLTVLGSGLSSTQFQANLTHADLTATDSGLITPNTKFAFAQNIAAAFTPGAGQYVTFAMAEGAWSGGGTASSNQSGCACLYQASGQTCSGSGGGSLNPAVSTTSPNVTVPTLPVGATVVGIYAVALASKATATGVFVGLNAFYTGVGSPSSYLMTGSWESTGNLGTNLSILNSAFFKLTLQATVTCVGGYHGEVTACGFAIVYTLSSGSPIPPNQLQTLQGTDCGFGIPSNSVVTGIEVDFQSGIASGSSCTLDFQLTLNGSPIGTPKSLSVGSWTTATTLGGSSDLWGTGGLTPAQINGSTGLGINVYGTIADNTQVNLNSVSITVFDTVTTYSHIPVVWVNVGNTIRPNV